MDGDDRSSNLLSSLLDVSVASPLPVEAHANDERHPTGVSVSATAAPTIEPTTTPPLATRASLNSMDRDDRSLDLLSSLLDVSVASPLPVEAQASDERQQHFQRAPAEPGPRDEYRALADASIGAAATAGGALAHDGASSSSLQANDLS